MRQHLRIAIDAMNICHIMRHVHKDLRVNVKSVNGGTEPLYTGVLFGVLRLLDSLMREFSPDEIVFVWDGKDSLWRKKLDPNYKANRVAKQKKSSPDEQHAMFMFHHQMIPDLRKCLLRLGVPSIEVAGLEADDVLGIMAYYTKNDATNPRLLIVSTDADFVQCVTHGRVRVYNPVTHCLYHQDRKTGALMYGGKTKPHAPSPKIFLWRKAMVGDTADNLKGMPGMGPARAEAFFPVKEAHDKETMSEYLLRVAPPYGVVRGKQINAAYLLTQMRAALMLVDLTHEMMLLELARQRGAKRAELRKMLRDEVWYARSTNVIDCIATSVKHPVPTKRIKKFPFQSPLFLVHPLNRDPSPAFNFFRRRDFQIATHPTDFVQMLERYAMLWERRKVIDQP